jgi:hypothetical protein
MFCSIYIFYTQLPSHIRWSVSTRRTFVNFLKLFYVYLRLSKVSANSAIVSFVDKFKAISGDPK